MANENGPSWLWVVLFALLAVPHVSAALHHANGRAGNSLVAAGFLVMAFAALCQPTGFLVVTWRQLRSPRTITARQYVSLAGAMALLIGAVADLLQI